MKKSALITITTTDCDRELYFIFKYSQIICLGDSAVGKSKLVERFLLDG
jgi:GTPase SAR1 family protein